MATITKLNDQTEVTSPAAGDLFPLWVSGAWKKFKYSTLTGLLSSSAGKTVYPFIYDFSVNGGATGSIVLTQASGVIPDKFIIQNAIIDVVTPLGSAGGATAALSTGQGAGDLQTATAISGAPWSTTGIKATTVLLGTVATMIKTTANRSPVLVVATANLNAGKFHLFIEGFQSS